MRSKKIISLLLLLSLLICVVPAYATPPVSDKGNFINEDEATTIAMLFVLDNIGLTKEWSYDTRVNEMIKLYDKNDQVNAYCITLSTDEQQTGYTIVSAWSATNLVMEYSDSATPVFQNDSELITGRSNKVYYMGCLNYTDDRTIAKTLENNIIYSSDLSEVNELFIDMLHENGIVTLAYATDPATNTWGGYINNPLTFLSNCYSQYASFTLNSAMTLTSASNQVMLYTMDCVICAVAGLVYTNRTAITGSSATWGTIYTNCYSVANGNNPFGYHYYSASSGIAVADIQDYIEDVMDSYNCSWLSGTYFANFFSKSKSEIDAGRATILNIATGGAYSNHTVQVYGYRIYSGSSSTSFKFLQIKDGTGSGGVAYQRYMIMDDSHDPVIATLNIAKP